MTHQIDWDRLARYVSGEADAGERAEVERWADAAPENRAALDAARRRWNAAAEPGAWDVNAAWSRLQLRLGETPTDTTVLPFRRREASRAWKKALTFIPLAAAAVLLVAVAIQFRRDVGTGTNVVSNPDGAVFSTGATEQRVFDLSDGSQVRLGAASTLRLAGGFGAGSREVFLEGQAFIRVTHDESRPFVVHAGGTRTVDLGTAFEVRAWPSEDVRVVVTEGSVEVRRDQEGPVAEPVAVLNAGDVARLSETNAEVRRRQDVERLIGWTRGELTFDDASLTQVARELERWFDVECRIEDPDIAALHYTGTLRIGDSLGEILGIVELALSSHGIRAVRDGRTVTFRIGPPVTPAVRRSALRAEVGA